MVRIEFGMLAISVVLPLVLLNLLLSTSRRTHAIVAAIVLAAIALAWYANTASGSWLAALAARPRVIVLVLVFVWGGLLGWAILDVRRAARRHREQFWDIRPSEPEFGEYCASRLMQNGWHRLRHHSDADFTICQLTRDEKRLTAIFLTTLPDPFRILSRLAVMRWRPFGETIVVTWPRPNPVFASNAAQMEWHVLDGRDLDRLNDLVERVVDQKRDARHKAVPIASIRA